MSGKHIVNLSISAGRLNLLSKFQKKGALRLDMITIFRCELLVKKITFEALYKYCMSGKHIVNLSISAGRLNYLPKFPKKGTLRLDMITIFRWELLGKMGVTFFREEKGCSFYIKVN